MPAFDFEGQRFRNPVELALHVIGGRWKMPILWRLRKRTWRYNELRRELAGISHKMLTQQLRELEHHGLISRTVHPVVPPHVDYALTPLGQTTVPIIESLREWGSAYRMKRARRDLRSEVDQHAAGRLTRSRPAVRSPRT